MERDIRKDQIIGSRRLSNYIWTIILSIGGFGFILASNIYGALAIVFLW